MSPCALWLSRDALSGSGLAVVFGPCAVLALIAVLVGLAALVVALTLDDRRPPVRPATVDEPPPPAGLHHHRAA
jgi:hypothetical protein